MFITIIISKVVLLSLQYLHVHVIGALVELSYTQKFFKKTFQFTCTTIGIECDTYAFKREKCLQRAFSKQVGLHIL